MVAVNEPETEVVTAEGDVVCSVPSYLMVIVEEPAKPVPDTATVEPTIPLVGLSVTEGLTVKLVDAELEDPSVV